MNMNDKLQIKTCPTCGSDQIRRVERNVTRKYKEQTYLVPALEFYECPICGEKIYDSAAMRKIEAYSPVYRKVKTVAEV